MARSAYKKPLLLLEDLYYFYALTNPEYNYRLRSFRNKTINALTAEVPYFLHQGNSYQDFTLTEYSIGRKLGEFSKTRKPFFFRSKKKR